MPCMPAHRIIKVEDGQRWKKTDRTSGDEGWLEAERLEDQTW
ncbi:MAG: hypothetical protein ACKOU6_19345 [Planctomycetota bacterium]